MIVEVCLEDYRNDLGGIDRLISLIEACRAVPRGESETLANISPGNERVGIEGAALAAHLDLPVLSGALFLYSCGRFELYVRDLVAAIIDDIADTSCYDTLPSQLKKEWRRRTFDVASNPRKWGWSEAEADQFVTALMSATSGASNANDGVRIPADVITIIDSNMRADILQELFKRVGVDSLWKEIGKQAKLKNLLEVSADGDCTAKARNFLDLIMARRNSIAHQSAETSYPSTDEVKKFIEYFRCLSEILLDVAKMSRR